jgi:hypothetical protein
MAVQYIYIYIEREREREREGDTINLQVLINSLPEIQIRQILKTIYKCQLLCRSFQYIPVWKDIVV